MNIIKNITKSLRVFLFCFVLIFSFNCIDGFCAKTSSKKSRHLSGITAYAAYAVDYSTQSVIFSRRANAKFYPASTVKLLTALVVLDQKDLKDEVVISFHAAAVAPTKAGLTKGARYSVKDLLKVLLATSANDAGVALAENVAGSESAFAVLMNKKAAKLGLKNSHFSNPTGLPDKRQITTAYDLSLIARAAFSNSFVSGVMKQKTVTIIGSDGKSISRDNHNKLLWRLQEPCMLGKTGYTRLAGHCYAGMANYDDGRVSVVILKSSRPYDDICKILSLAEKKNKNLKS